ncbi:NADP-dependent oxidoreductase, partial [Agromyces humi]|uniref:NADP-dependent oxidoreductase n=1 Tax=Agromyces humi TaxID=1766800 RepID=UPI00135BEC17
MAETMQALVIDRTGEADELHLAEVPRPTRVSDEVVVRVVAAGVNPIDVKTRAGRGVATAIGSYPAVLGNDFSGIVETVPYAAHPLQPGDRVYGMGRVPRLGGSYAEFIAVSSLSVAPMPASLGFVEAAAVPLAALTAWGAVIDTARAHEGQRMLVHAASGGVGHFAVQLAAYFGAEVTATCSARNVDFARSLGARHVIDYTSERFEQVASEQADEADHGFAAMSDDQVVQNAADAADEVDRYTLQLAELNAA